VTFVDVPFTSEVYAGVVEISVKEVRDVFPRDTKRTEQLLSGSGVDPYLLAGVVELSAASVDRNNKNGEPFLGPLIKLLDFNGDTALSSSSSTATRSDIDILTATFSNGVNDLQSAVHVGRSSTAWSNVGVDKMSNKRNVTSTSNSKTRYTAAT